MKIFVVTIIAAVIAVVQCCERSTFDNVKIKASKYFSSDNDPDDIKIEEPLSECITPSDELKNAVRITITKQQVPVLHEGAVQDMEWLHELNLDDNGIKEIKSGAFQNLPSISSISLAKNQLEEIPEGVFNNMQVRRLYLNDNSISNIAPKAFDDMPNLRRIDLDHNKLQEWNSNWFANTPNINFLSVTFNEITGLPPRSFKNFKSKHEGTFPITTSIFMSNNKIEDIHPKAFTGLKHLDFLDLDKNSIVKVDAAVFANIESIQKLVLSNNKITCMSESVLDSLPSTELFSLEGNPIDCSCLKRMQNWAKEHVINIKMSTRKIECMQERIRNVLDSVKDVN